MENTSNKEYNALLNKLYNSSNISIDSLTGLDKEKCSEFKEFYFQNIKKSTFLASILPSILFLVISLVSFTLLILKEINANLGVTLENSNLEVPILFFGCLFMFFALTLMVRRFIFKIRVIRLERGRKKGYNQLNNKKYLEIVNLLDNFSNKMGINDSNN